VPFSSNVTFGVLAGTVATIFNVSDEPIAGGAGTLGAVHLITPLLPTGGSVQVSSRSCVSLTN
jgi:uncharacterized membrane protein